MIQYSYLPIPRGKNGTIKWNGDEALFESDDLMVGYRISFAEQVEMETIEEIN